MVVYDYFPFTREQVANMRDESPYIVFSWFEKDGKYMDLRGILDIPYRQSGLSELLHGILGDFYEYYGTIDGFMSLNPCYRIQRMEVKENEPE